METSYVGHLISEGSSTSAVFSDEGQLLAYILCCPDSRILNGFVRSNHRRKGLYQVVSYAYGRREKWWLLENLSLGFIRYGLERAIAKILVKAIGAKLVQQTLHSTVSTGWIMLQVERTTNKATIVFVIWRFCLDFWHTAQLSATFLDFILKTRCMIQ